MSHSEESLRENIGAFINALLLAKPAGLKKGKLCLLFSVNFSLMNIKLWTQVHSLSNVLPLLLGERLFPSFKLFACWGKLLFHQLNDYSASRCGIFFGFPNLNSLLLLAASKYAGYVNSFHICSTVILITLVTFIWISHGA